MTFQYILSAITDMDFTTATLFYLGLINILIKLIIGIQNFQYALKRRKTKQKQKEIDALEAKIHDLKNKPCA